MRTSKYLLYTIKEIPHNTDSISYQLMLRAGIIRKSAVGLYTWLPSGLRVLKKINNIIRYEMNKLGAIEVSFPIMQTDILWKKSNRLKKYGKELIQLYDRNNNRFILSPTYEEMATDFIKNEIKSYKKLPIILYQIQKKFRDERRPRSGTIRAREFIMKDAYSFHENINSLNNTYFQMYQTYINIFKKMNLIFYPVKAESGIMGGKYSHEFQSLSKNGEDQIIIHNNKIKCKNNFCIYAENIKYVRNVQHYISENILYNKNEKELQKIFYTMKKKIIKIFIIKILLRKKYQFIGLIIKGENTLNIKKINKINIFHLNKKKIFFANSTEIKKIINNNNSINLIIPLITDPNVVYLKEIIPMVIINNIFFTNIILSQNFQYSQIYSIIDTKNSYNTKKIAHCIEIGHIFQIGQKYSRDSNTKINNIHGEQKFIHMGCYGIGITRLVSAIIEQNHDHKGIIWPSNIAPFEVLIIPINFHQCKKIKKISESLYKQCRQYNLEVLLEDREERIGILFNDANLLGIPNIIIINQNTINNNTVEYQERKYLYKKKIINMNNIINIIIQKLKNIKSE
ncbi:proline--tRNA ligase [Buchnera aphidicola]|uniref:proline--tRNA ligase n=1 Tax=Buchnera aphidicola TaxID=9 RepID=UPI00346487B9